MSSSTWLEALPSELFYTHLSGLRSNDLLLFRGVSRAYDTYAQTKTFIDQDASAIDLQKKLLAQWISNPDSMKISAELVLNRLDHPDYDFYARLTAILLLMKKQNRSFEVSQEKIDSLIHAYKETTTEAYEAKLAGTLLSVFAPDFNETQLALVLPAMIADQHCMSFSKLYRFKCTWSALAWRMSAKQLADTISSLRSKASEYPSVLTRLIIHLKQSKLDEIFASEMQRLSALNTYNTEERLNTVWVLRALLHRLSKNQIATLFAQVEKMLREHQERIPYETICLLHGLSPFLTAEQAACMFTLMQEKFASNRKCALKIMEAIASRLNGDQIDVLLAPLKEALRGEDNDEDGDIPDIYFEILKKLMLRMNPQQYNEIWMLLIKATGHSSHAVRCRSFQLLAKHNPYQSDQVAVTLEKLTKMLDSEPTGNDIYNARDALIVLASQLTNQQLTTLLQIGLNKLKCPDDESGSLDNGFAMLRACVAAPALDDNQIIDILKEVKSRFENRLEKLDLLLMLKSLAARLNTEQIADVFPWLITSLKDKYDCNAGRYASEVLNILASRLNDDQVRQVVSTIGAHVLKDVYDEKANLLSRLVLLGKCDTTMLQAANIASMAGGEWICFFAERFEALQQAPDQKLTNPTPTLAPS